MRGGGFAELPPLPFIGQFMVRMFLICLKDYATNPGYSVN
jgi:hypothetical protein